MTSVALAVVVANRSCCNVAEFLRELRSAKISSPESGFGDSDGRQQRPHKILVNSGSGGSDGAWQATSVGQ